MKLDHYERAVNDRAELRAVVKLSILDLEEFANNLDAWVVTAEEKGHVEGRVPYAFLIAVRRTFERMKLAYDNTDPKKE